MSKSPEMQRCLDNMAKSMFGRTSKDHVCITCGSTEIEPKDFRNAISLKEYGISHMCQQCQDSVFGHD